MTNEKIKEILRGTAAFSGAGERSLSALCACTSRRFSAGETIYSAASYRPCFCVILSGKLEISGASGASPVRLKTASAGDTFGAAALFGSRGTYVSTVAARTACEVLFIPEQTLSDVLSSDPSAALSYIAFLSERIRFLNEKITSFTAKNADAAVAGALAEESDGAPINMSRLSKQLGIGRTSLYRSFENLSRAGLISYSDGTVRILQRKELKALSLR